MLDTRRNSVSHRQSIQASLQLAGAAVVVTLLAFVWAWCEHQAVPERLSPPEGLDGLNFAPYWVGQLVRLAIVPVALLYLYSGTSLFRRMLGGKAHADDGAKFFAGLLLIQLLTFGYNLIFAYLVYEPPEFSYLALVSLVVVAGGFWGGWRIGLALGAVSMLLRGTHNFAIVMYWQSSEIAYLWGAGGLSDVLKMPWGEFFLHSYLLSPLATSALWVGAFSGLAADLLGKHRLYTLCALLFGVVVDLGAAGLLIVAGEVIALDFVVPGMLVTGLVVVALALVVRGVEGEIARRQAAAAELARTRAELRALRAQINPHFLFNALNTIRYFVRTDPETARRLLLDLSRVFQRALRSGELVPLRDEIAYVEAYLALESARLDERLQVVWSVPIEGEEGGRSQDGTANWRDVLVPTLILQPLVENAVLHGVSRKPEGGTVRIDLRQAGRDLRLQVEDDGPGIPAERLAQIRVPATQDDPGVGLRNVDGRLRALYGEDYGLAIESEPGQGTRVTIRIPVER